MNTDDTYWKLNKKLHCLEIYDGAKLVYEIDLEHCNSGAAIADWIFQISKKDWASDVFMGDLVHILDVILDPQKNFCANENNTIIPVKDMATFLRERYTKYDQN